MVDRARLEMPATRSTSEIETAFKRQRVAFFLALANFLGRAAWSWMRIYYTIAGDPKADRTSVFNTLGLLPIWCVIWIIGFVIVGNSATKSKRVTWHGVGAIVMLAIPAIPVTTSAFISFWRFLSAR